MAASEPTATRQQPQPQHRPPQLRGLVAAGITLVGLAMAAGYLAGLGWPLELFSHFRAQYAGALVVGALLAAALRAWRLGAAALLLAAANAVPLAPAWFGDANRLADGRSRHALAADSAVPTYRLLVHNVLHENTQAAAWLAWVKEQQPDVLVVVETDARWIVALQALRETLPYAWEQPREDAFGIALYSRWPLAAAQTLEIASSMPAVAATVRTPRGPLRIVGMHPPPPMSARLARARDHDLVGVAEWLQAEPLAAASGACIVCGDLNCTPYAPAFQAFIAASGLRDSRHGYGLHATWPAHAPYLYVPLDHALVGDAIAVRQRRVGPALGSDHHPVVLDFALAAAADGPASR